MFFFFFNDTATTEIYTLSLHDALPICLPACLLRSHAAPQIVFDVHLHMALQLIGKLAVPRIPSKRAAQAHKRSEEHTSELQSQFHLVCRLLLEKKKIRSL